MTTFDVWRVHLLPTLAGQDGRLDGSIGSSMPGLTPALFIDEVNQLGRDTGRANPWRTVTPHRLLLAFFHLAAALMASRRL